jgi:hypothetical protein
MQYFLKNFTMHHIQRHEYIQVFSRNREVAKVKMVMSKLKVNEKGKGGAMITINWMDVVKHNDMKVVKLKTSTSSAFVVARIVSILLLIFRGPSYLAAIAVSLVSFRRSLPTT